MPPKASNIPAVTVPVETKFNSYPVITLPHPDDVTQPGIQFGVKKLRAVLANLDAVRAFVAKHHVAAKPTAQAATAAIDAAAKMRAMLIGLGCTPEEIEKALGAGNPPAPTP